MFPLHLICFFGGYIHGGALNKKNTMYFYKKDPNKNEVVELNIYICFD